MACGRSGTPEAAAAAAAVPLYAMTTTTMTTITMMMQLWQQPSNLQQQAQLPIGRDRHPCRGSSWSCGC